MNLVAEVLLAVEHNVVELAVINIEMVDSVGKVRIGDRIDSLD